MDLPHFIYPFIHQRTLGLLLSLAMWVMLLWTWVRKYLFEFLLSILLGIYPEVEWLNHMVILFFNFLRTLHTVFQCLHYFTCPPATYKGSIFSTSSPTLVSFCLFVYNSCPNWCKVVSYCDFVLNFLND